jgi:hypothetical protein
MFVIPGKNNEWYKYDDNGSSVVKVVKESSNEAYAEFQQQATVLFYRCKCSVQAQSRVGNR